MRKNILTFGTIVISGLLLPVALGFGSAHAFTETPVPQSGGQQQQAPLTQTAPIIGNQALPSGKTGASMSLTDPASGGKSAEGTEVKIPGIGAVGTLPKLDFGLELLYGNNGDVVTQEKPSSINEDVMIKGTLKHKF